MELETGRGENCPHELYRARVGSLSQVGGRGPGRRMSHPEAVGRVVVIAAQRWNGQRGLWVVTPVSSCFLPEEEQPVVSYIIS